MDKVTDTELIDWLQSNLDRFDLKCNLAFSTPFILCRPTEKVGDVIYHGNDLRHLILNAMTK